MERRSAQFYNDNDNTTANDYAYTTTTIINNNLNKQKKKKAEHKQINIIAINSYLFGYLDSH